MMKITYHISETTDIQPRAISERILSLLDKPGYVILEKTNEIIEFKYNIWRFGSRTRVLGKVDGGRFAIKNKEDGVELDFSYYVSPVFWVLFTSFFAFFGIFQDYRIFYSIPVILIAFLFKVENVKSTAKEWMKGILNVA